MNKLNPKQQLFVKFYLEVNNATEAAVLAGYGKTRKSARAQASALLSHPVIKPMILKAREDERKEIENRAQLRGITKDRWLQELEVIAFSNMDEFATVEEKHRAQGEEGEFYTSQSVSVVPTKKRARHQGRAIKKLVETKNGMGVELHSKQAALELIGKHYGWVKESIDLTTPGSVQIHLTMPTNGREAPDALPPVLPTGNQPVKAADDSNSKES